MNKATIAGLMLFALLILAGLAAANGKGKKRKPEKSPISGCGIVYWHI